MEILAVPRAIDIPQHYLDQWQKILNLTARLMGVPAALVMRLSQDVLEVYVTSQTKGNPYKVGLKDHLWDSGHYCEAVLKARDKVLVPNALTDENWKHNPDIKLNMISYLGYPINYPDGQPFGTLCVLDNKENEYSQDYVELLGNMRDLLQSHLSLIYMNHALQTENVRLSDYISEIKTLRGMIPICAHCKKIRDDQGYWEKLELYLEEHTEAEFSHGLCPDCMKLLYPEISPRKYAEK